MDKYLKSALTQTQAEARAQLFTPTKDNITYTLYLKIKKGDTYEGVVTTHFDLQNVSSDFFFEYAGTTINEIIVNGQKLETNDNYESLRDKRFLRLPQDQLKKGKNEVRIKFANLYANDGIGLHSFTDTDDKQYVYSKSEPYGTNKIFPCFDQPDLKAKLSLVMAFPSEWVAIANEPVWEEAKNKINVKEYLTEEEQSQHKVLSFLTTPLLPTYLFVFIAGPYKEIKSNKIHRNITMSCYCRESLLQYLKDQAEEIFDITRECIKFYESYFDYPYPFSKYDSVFCPEFSSGAMENPGAVTFNDDYIWREQVTVDDNTERADTITHEASHHWFGDLVTMKWWNDLWLNESFADFISYYCLYKIKDKVTTTKFSDVWLGNFTRKGWGYRTDQLKSTHPIAGEVLNTDQAESVFDGITYSKGAATLKQLMSLIGEENFGKAMASYFKKYEWSNTVLNDYIASLQEFYKPAYQGSPASLSEWKAEWLQTAGLNECIPLFNPDDRSEEAKLVIKQSAVLEEFPTLRHHKMKIAFFDKDAQIYEVKDIMLNATQETVITYNGAKEPKAVFLNYLDEAFIKVRLDPHSINFFREKVTLVPDELTRAMIWRSLYDMVRDGILSGYKFVEIVEQGLGKESSDSTLGNILLYSRLSIQFCPFVLGDNVIKPKLFDCTLKALLATEKSNTNRIVLLRDYLIQFASYGEQKNIDNVSRLMGWLDGEDKDLKDFELDLSNKWKIIHAIHRHPKLPDAEKSRYFKKVAETDSSDRMKQAAAKCEAMRADENARKDLFTSFLDPENKTSVNMLTHSMTGYTNSVRYRNDDAVAFFDNVVQVFKTRNNEFAIAFYESMFPEQENLSFYIQKVNELKDQAKDDDWLLKSLQESLDDLERKRKGYLCCGPDIMKEFFNISI